MVKRKLIPYLIFILAIVLISVAYVVYNGYKINNCEVSINSLKITGDCDVETAKNAQIFPESKETVALDASELSRFELSQTMVFKMGGKSYECEYSESEIGSLGSSVSHKYMIKDSENKKRYICVNSKGEIISAFLGVNLDEPEENWQLDSEIDILFPSRGGMNDLGEYDFDEQKLRKILENEFKKVFDFSEYNCFNVDHYMLQWGGYTVKWWYERDGISYGKSLVIYTNLYPYTSSTFPSDFRTGTWFSVKPYVYKFEMYDAFANDPFFDRGNAWGYKYCWVPNQKDLSEIVAPKMLEWLNEDECPIKEFDRLYKDIERYGRIIGMTTYENRLCVKVAFKEGGLRAYSKVESSNPFWDDWHGVAYVDVAVLILL